MLVRVGQNNRSIHNQKVVFWCSDNHTPATRCVTIKHASDTVSEKALPRGLPFWIGYKKPVILDQVSWCGVLKQRTLTIENLCVGGRGGSHEPHVPVHGLAEALGIVQMQAVLVEGIDQCIHNASGHNAELVTADQILQQEIVE